MPSAANSVRLRTAAAVAMGGAIGTAARYEIGAYWGAADPSRFPWTTLTVNLVGSFVLGVLMMRLQVRRPSDYLRAFVGVGILGGFTTFSAFAVEAVRLTQKGFGLVALIYVVVSLIGGIAAILLGGWLVAARARPADGGGPVR